MDQDLRDLYVAYIKSQEPPLKDVYMVEKENPYWSKYGRMSYGIGDVWHWLCDFDKLSDDELSKLYKNIKNSNN